MTKVGKREGGKAGMPEGRAAGASESRGGGRPEGGPRGPAVWVVEGGKPRRIAVTPGLSDGIVTAVESDELREGMEVLVESPAAGRGTRGTSAFMPQRMPR